MRVQATPATLRAEAKVLMIGGFLMQAFGFPVTLILVAGALSPAGLAPALPIVVGAPPLLLGYAACHLAARRLAKANAMDKGPARKSSQHSNRVSARC